MKHLSARWLRFLLYKVLLLSDENEISIWEEGRVTALKGNLLEEEYQWLRNSWEQKCRLKPQWNIFFFFTTQFWELSCRKCPGILYKFIFRDIIHGSLEWSYIYINRYVDKMHASVQASSPGEIFDSFYPFTPITPHQ